MMRNVAALFLVAMIGANVGCAHKQPTTKQIAVGAVVVVGFSLLLYLAVEQCNKGANYCDNSPSP
jgi:energy-converting hydrogenase Eha subunit E